MNELDAIIAKINQDNDRTVSEILRNAEREAAEITQKAKAETEIQAAQLLKKAEETAKLISENSKSSCLSLEKRELLHAKTDIISDWTVKALCTAKSLDTEEYFLRLKKLAVSHATKESGTIAFSKNDLERLPEGFVDGINKTTGGKLTLDKAPANIDSGFIISYGEVDENCSFDALLEQHSDEISDRLFLVLNA